MRAAEAGTLPAALVGPAVRASALVARWEEAHAQGQGGAPEALCPDRPELHDLLRRAAATMRRLREGRRQRRGGPLRGRGVHPAARADGGRADGRGGARAGRLGGGGFAVGLRDPRRAGARGDGGGLQGAAARPEPAGGAEDDPGRRARRRRRAGALPGGGGGGGEGAASGHRAGLRVRHARRPALLLAGAVRGRFARRPAGAVAAWPRRRRRRW